MISVILYGRNDAHGYNLHRRAALSLNCLAEVLTHPEDEIVFVDYNTPHELPTFIEAIADTLTDRCLGLIRVLRVPSAIHRLRFAERTHLPALEPVARNAGIRRANPSNRWLLSTNTDMVFLPLTAGSLSDICGELPDGFYGLPRFELPEWLWERLPRGDPRTTLAEVERLGPRLGLDEPTVSHEWIRFDAPGDFQLVLRDDFVAVDGFNEEMLLGYHVDSNLSRRMLLRRGSIESLGDYVAGYHCNHNRIPTIYHGARVVQNDYYRFFYAVERAELPKQRATWGLADSPLEEVPIRTRVGLAAADHVAAVVAGESYARIASDAFASVLDVTYDSGHVLPFVADSLLVSSTDVTVGYIGANPILQKLLAELAASLGIKDVVVADLDEPFPLEDHSPDVVVVDLGLDASVAETEAIDGGYRDFLALTNSLEQAFAALGRFVLRERERLARGEHPRRLVLVNSATAFWDAYVLTHLECSHSTPYSRVRRATVRPVPEKTYAATAPGEVLHRQIRWSLRRRAGEGRLHLPPDRRIRLSELEDFRGFGEGWADLDSVGVWTHGSRAELALELDGDAGYGCLAIGIDGISVEPGGSIGVEIRADGEYAAARDFGDTERADLASPHWLLSPRLIYTARAILPDVIIRRLSALYWRLSTPATLRTGVRHLKEIVWRIELPAGPVARGSTQLTFLIRKASAASAAGSADAGGELGIHLRSLKLERLDRA